MDNIGLKTTGYSPSRRDTEGNSRVEGKVVEDRRSWQPHLFVSSPFISERRMTSFCSLSSNWRDLRHLVPIPAQPKRFFLEKKQEEGA
ncbi:hypothetical protein AAMO2058_000520000 [Amorphochlora amoebiformis]